MSVYPGMWFCCGSGWLRHGLNSSGASWVRRSNNGVTDRLCSCVQGHYKLSRWRRRIDEYLCSWLFARRRGHTVSAATATSTQLVFVRNGDQRLFGDHAIRINFTSCYLKTSVMVKRRNWLRSDRVTVENNMRSVWTQHIRSTCNIGLIDGL